MAGSRTGAGPLNQSGLRPGARRSQGRESYRRKNADSVILLLRWMTDVCENQGHRE